MRLKRGPFQQWRSRMSTLSCLYADRQRAQASPEEGTSKGKMRKKRACALINPIMIFVVIENYN